MPDNKTQNLEETQSSDSGWIRGLAWALQETWVIDKKSYSRIQTAPIHQITKKLLLETSLID